MMHCNSALFQTERPTTIRRIMGSYSTLEKNLTLFQDSLTSLSGVTTLENWSQRVQPSFLGMFWSDRDSNPEFSACKADALPVWPPPLQVLFPSYTRYRNLHGNERVPIIQWMMLTSIWTVPSCEITPRMEWDIRRTPQGTT